MAPLPLAIYQIKLQLAPRRLHEFEHLRPWTCVRDLRPREPGGAAGGGNHPDCLGGKIAYVSGKCVLAPQLGKHLLLGVRRPFGVFGCAAVQPFPASEAPGESGCRRHRSVPPQALPVAQGRKRRVLLANPLLEVSEPLLNRAALNQAGDHGENVGSFCRI
jgi:hypothetical protein